MPKSRVIFCLSMIFLLSAAFLSADERIGVEGVKTKYLEPGVQVRITAEEMPLEHFKSKCISENPIPGGFGGRDAPWSANILAADGWGGALPDQYTSMAIGPDGAIYVAYQAMYTGSSDWDFGVARSTDNGLTWSTYVNGTVNDDMYPDVAVDDDGYIWIYMTMYDADPSGEIIWARSDSPNNISSFTISWFGGIAGAGQYYIHPSADAFGSDGSNLHIFVAWSFDDGDADDQMCFVKNDGVIYGGWTITTFSEDGETDMHPDVAISTNNVVMANIEDVSGDKELRIWYLDIASVWAGAGWNVISYTITGDDDYPSIYATGTNVFVAFQNDAGGGNLNDIVHGNSADDGATWDLGAYVANTASIEHYPRVSGLSDVTGVVYLEGSNVRFRQSGSLGQAGTWDPDIALAPERVTDQDAADESVRSASLMHSGVAWVASWADDRNFASKDFDIWSSYRDVGVSQISTNPSTPDSFVYFDYTSGKGFGTLSYITKYCERTYNPILTVDVQEKMENASSDELIGILITMKKQVSHDYLLAVTTPMGRKERRYFVWQELSKFAEKTQKDILAYLSTIEAEGKAKRIGSIFTGNRVRARVTKDVIEKLA